MTRWPLALRTRNDQDICYMPSFSFVHDNVRVFLLSLLTYIISSTSFLLCVPRIVVYLHLYSFTFALLRARYNTTPFFFYFL